MTKQTSGLEQYITVVSKIMPVSCFRKRAILKEIRLMLADIPGVDQMSFNELLTVVDPPEQLMETFVREHRAKAARGFSKTKKFITAAFVLIVVICLGLVGFFIADHIDFERREAKYRAEHNIPDNLSDLETEGGDYFDG